jgi:hypothetical protein
LLPELTGHGFAGILGGMATVIAIDPGVSGAWAKVSNDSGAPAVLALRDLPTYAEKTNAGKIRRYIDAAALLAELKKEKPDLLICERMTAPPGISSNTAFSMGATMGALQTVARLLGFPARFVVSSVWKRAIDCPADKEAARQYAGRLLGFEHWPLKMHHNRAEAALIGLYGLASFGQPPRENAPKRESESR